LESTHGYRRDWFKERARETLAPCVRRKQELVPLDDWLQTLRDVHNS